MRARYGFSLDLGDLAARLQHPRWRRFLLRRLQAASLVVGLTVVLPLGWSAGIAAAEEPAVSTGGTTDAKVEAPAAPPEVIPVEKIALRATEVATLLGTFGADFVPSHEIETIRKALPAVNADLAERLQSTLEVLKEEPSLETLQILERLWWQRQRQLADWLSLLTDRATRLQNDLTQLQQLQTRWTQTRDAHQTATAPDQTLRQIGETLAVIEEAKPRNRAQLDQALDLQGKVAQEVIRCETARTRISQLQKGAVGGIFARDAHPLWRPQVWSLAGASLSARLSEISVSYGLDARQYMRDPAKHMPLHLGLFILSFVALLAGRGQVVEWTTRGKELWRVTTVFDHPFAAALLLALMAATTVFAPTPFGVKQLFSAAALLPMIVLARPLVRPALVPVLYTLGVLFALDTLRHAFAGIPPLVDQIVITLESVAGGIVLARFLVRRGLLHAHGETMRSGWERFGMFVAAIALLGLAIGGVAGVLGYLRIARLTTPAILVGGADALWLYAVVEVASAVVGYALRVWPLRGLRMVRNHQRLLEIRVHRLFVWMGVVAWFVRYVDYLGLWDPIQSFAGELLDTRWQMGSFSTSAGDVLSFGLTLVIAYLVSAVIRFVLEEEVYPRTGVAAGISYAASSVFHYAIVTVSFLIALGFLGVTLTQVTVLAGALGVGIGFGLQSVVNNFVSGLILLFERPINVGDAVQVGNLQGWVRRIGIRASVVRTLEGAEIIVPNAQLTTEQVTNWTLTDRLRRIDVPVGVSYGTSPHKVIDLLEGVARAHPKVLENPRPQCLFVGYGDSSINFELRAWTEYTHSIQARSDLTVAAYDAVYAVGMSFPFPQREVRLLSDPPARYDGGGGQPENKPR